MAEGEEYRKGFQDGISAFEKELSSEETAEAALKSFGWKHRVSVITLKALLKEAVFVALKKLKK